jgi:hypothetical protein
MNCCICGTVRNCGPYLDKIFSNMEQIGSLFEDYRIILYYDYSTDDSLEQLKNYSEKNDKMILYVNTSPMLPYRTHRISLGRNVCLQIIREQFPNYPFFIMMDCDDKGARDVRLDVLKDYIHQDVWDCLTFQHPVGYYDSWALSKLPYVLSCHHFEDTGTGQRMIENIIKKTSHDELIPCLSAFNGFALYRSNKFLNCCYDGRYRIDYIPGWMTKAHLKTKAKPKKILSDSLKHEDCEHRFFHINAVIKNGARIRISPKCFFV